MTQLRAERILKVANENYVNIDEAIHDLLRRRNTLSLTVRATVYAHYTPRQERTISLYEPDGCRLSSAESGLCRSGIAVLDIRAPRHSSSYRLGPS